MNTAKEKVSITKVLMKYRNLKKEQKKTKTVTGTERDNLKGRFLGPFNNYHRKTVAYPFQPSVASISSAYRGKWGLVKSC